MRARAGRGERAWLPGPGAAAPRAASGPGADAWLRRLLADEAVTDVLVNGPGEVWVERCGELRRAGVSLDRAAIELFVERALAPLGRRVDRTSPLVDARLPDGSRLHVALPPVAPDGPCVTVRRFAAHVHPLSAFGPPEVVEVLVGAVRARECVVVSGATGAGKTSLLNALAAHVADGERVVTIEDSAELRLPGPHVVRLEARPPSADGTAGVTVGDLVRTVLRMRPDRIVVGECRGPEAYDLVQALHTGHRGALTTVHANDPADALRRLETMVLAADRGMPPDLVRTQVCSAVDVVVHLGRASGGGRRVVEVCDTAPLRAAPDPAGTPSLGVRWSDRRASRS